MVMAKTRLRSLTWCGLLFILTCLLPLQEAQVTLITYSFEGTVNDIFGPVSSSSPRMTSQLSNPA
jgi:hypothetical protein